jgi:hypothetical protein
MTAQLNNKRADQSKGMYSLNRNPLPSLWLSLTLSLLVPLSPVVFHELFSPLLEEHCCCWSLFISEYRSLLFVMLVHHPSLIVPLSCCLSPPVYPFVNLPLLCSYLLCSCMSLISALCLVLCACFCFPVEIIDFTSHLLVLLSFVALFIFSHADTWYSSCPTTCPTA